MEGLHPTRPSLLAYTIPPSSPLHYLTYVQVYGSTPDQDRHRAQQFVHFKLLPLAGQYLSLGHLVAPDEFCQILACAKTAMEQGAFQNRSFFAPQFCGMKLQCRASLRACLKIRTRLNPSRRHPHTHTKKNLPKLTDF